MTTRLSLYLITLVLTIPGFNVMGQDHMPIFSEKEWQVEIVDLPGIGSNNIFEEMLQDSFGFLWIGSGDGLIRYDGHRTKIFVHDPNNPNSLASNDISELLLQDNRYLWIGSYSNGGLDRMDLTSGRISHYLDSTSVTEIIRDNNGFIWVGSIGGLYRIYPIGDSIQISQYFLEDTSNETVWTILEDRNGAIWAGTGIYNERGHIYKYIPEIDSFQQYVLQFDGADEVFDSPVSSLLEDSHHKLWGGTSEGNVFQIDRQTSQVTYLDLDLPTNRKRCIGSIFEDFDQKIWIVTAGGGLFRIDPLAGEQMHFGTNSIGPEIPSDIGWTICQSQDSILWIGGGRAGGILFKVYKSAPQLTNIPLEGLSTYSFFENSSTSTHEIYIGTDDGIVFYDLENGIKQHYAQDLLLPLAKDRIVMHNLRRGHDASLWVACLSSIDEKFNGLLKVDPNSQRFRFYPLPIDTAGLGFKMRSYNYNTIRDFEFLNTGKILVATLGSGLYLFDPESEQFVHNQDFPEGFESLPSDFISDVFKDHQGAVYITGWKRGPGSVTGFGTKFLARLDPDFTTLVNLELPESIKRPAKRCFEEIFSAGNGGIWLQSRRDGFIRLDTSMHATRIANPLTSDLLPVDISVAIKVDDQFWIKIQNSIYRFNPAIGKITSNFIACAGSGVARNQFNFRKALQLEDGTMLFGAENGFQRLDPQLSHRSMNSRVAFSSIQILKEKSGSLNKSLNFLSRQQEITLKHDENSFVIDFFIPDYRDPKNNQYEFKLDDYESDWQEVDEPKASYRRLAPGQYRFQVRAKGYRYAQTVEGSIQLTILPPWYWAWWSKSLYFLILTSLIYWIYQYQLKRQLALAEAHRLKELDTFKSRLYTNITHEFRTPLTVILGLTDQLQEKVKETGKAGLHTIKRNGNRLLSLVNQILDLQKLEAGAMSVHLIQGDIVQYLKYLTESFHSYAESKNIQLQFSSDPEVLMMDYDPEKIQDIFLNLISNALKFTPSGGIINIDCRIENSGQFRMMVRDNGRGISEEMLPHIFDRFYQVDDSSVRQGEGTGIGLALSQELVKLLGGEISVKSILGAGSEFTVLLPINQSAPLATDPIQDKRANVVSLDPVITQTILNGENLKELPQILIIEDNQDVVQYIVSVLNENYHITTASDGKKGLEQALQNIPDLIISDVMMSEMDGYQVCNTLKQDTRTSHIPIILLTAKADIDSKLEGLQYGADVYMTKPFLKEELLVRIKSLLSQKERLQKHYKQLFGIVTDSEETGQNIQISAPENEFITKVKTVIKDHLDDSTFGVDQLCQTMTMSNSQLYRKLKAQTGLSAHDLIQSIRLAHAKSLLKETENSISEIAYDCGFSDPEYFSRVFKKEMGSSPSEFRHSYVVAK